MKTNKISLFLLSLLIIPCVSGCNDKPATLESFSHEFVSKEFETNEVLDEYLSQEGIFSVVMHYSDKSTKKINYVDFSKNAILFEVFNPTGNKVNPNYTFASVGTWTMKTSSMTNFSIYAETTFKVTLPPTLVYSISLNKEYLSLNKNDTFQMKVKEVLPTNATNPNYHWESSDEDIVTIDQNGLVTAKNPGEALLSAVCEDRGHKASYCKVLVSNETGFNKTMIQETYYKFKQKNIYELDCPPLIGDMKALILPIWFTDSANYITEDKKEQVRQDIGKAYLGSNEDTGWRSVKTYYEELSNGKLEINGTLADWYEAEMEARYCYTEDTMNLVKLATDAYFNKNKQDRRQYYDRDGNGYLDAVVLIYAAPDAKSHYLNDNMWGYTYWLQQSALKSQVSPGPNSFFWASYDFMYDSITALQRAGTKYGIGDSSYCNIDTHCFIHEMGHVLGVPDFYDYSNQFYPAGGFNMQDHNVGSHDPYSCLSFGWADPYIPTESCSITLSPFQESKELILLTPEWNSLNSCYDEYFLIEYYTPTGLNEFDTLHRYRGYYPQGLSESGIRLWHVDGRLSSINGGTPFVGIGTKTNFTEAIVNTYDGNGVERARLSPCGQNYYNMNGLQLIKNDENASYKSSVAMKNGDLFKYGDSFKMSKFQNQFVNKTKLNNGKNLSWEFTVQIVQENNQQKAKINLTKI